MNNQTIPTRFLILSDTHGSDLSHPPTATFDVAIHCGDLTHGSTLAEYKQSIDLLRSIRAPLKLVIAGNHDFTLDPAAFRHKLASIPGGADPLAVQRTYGDPGESRSLFSSAEARDAGIVFLDEGSHRFELDNGAALAVYASPYTPAYGDWAFQYPEGGRRRWEVPAGTDVVVTHGPPRGILDRPESGGRAGDEELFAAVACVQPRLHCFGHVHRGWGARRVVWREPAGEMSQSGMISHFTAINNDKSETVESLATIKATRFDTGEDVEEKARRLLGYQERGFVTAAAAGRRGDEAEDEDEDESATMFVNAAIKAGDGEPQQLPWVVELDLPRVREC